jgi:diadenosine tetraphosphate (Ap4A) HIT family hydrolase
VTNVWSDDWRRWRSGDGCPFCAEGRPDVRDIGVRFYEGTVLDAYLLTGHQSYGSTILVWRGRHVDDPVEMQPDELQAYMEETHHVARALQAVFDPVKINYTIAGTHVPHLHTVIILRHADDPKPNEVLVWSAGSVRDKDQIDATIRELAEATAQPTVAN